MSTKTSYFPLRVLPKHSYRIRIREEAFATDAARIHWRVSSRPPARYDTSRACLEQGIVQLKGGDLLLTSLTPRDVRRRIQGTLADGRKINIQLRNAGVKLGLGKDNRKFLMWTAIITGRC
ncbi:hypothetical protein OESDEN_06681 [Oesophagostomum dentatum]|uniref:Uncharacterized protein n=1 Tax=Oesophagostomum dentatum TaxID=61180 RepID=A0A0B1T835_OESDE|nr:hypothetical protein OESDEN_06681 [Oesophagostomum dentatum]